MDYLTELAADPRVSGSELASALRDDGRQPRRAVPARAAATSIDQFGSWWVGTHHNPNADHNWALGLSEFDMTYFRRTILMPILHLLPDTPLTMQLDWDNGQCQRIARQVEAIKRARRARSSGLRLRPLPACRTGRSSSHRTGGCLDQKESEARGEPQGYAEQVAYADTIIEELVTTLLAEGRPGRSC